VQYWLPMYLFSSPIPIQINTGISFHVLFSVYSSADTELTFGATSVQYWLSCTDSAHRSRYRSDINESRAGAARHRHLFRLPVPVPIQSRHSALTQCKIPEPERRDTHRQHKFQWRSVGGDLVFLLTGERRRTRAEI
jgi:hypothetical protein